MKKNKDKIINEDVNLDNLINNTDRTPSSNKKQKSKHNYKNILSDKLKLLDLNQIEEKSKSLNKNINFYNNDEFIYQIKLNKSVDNINLVKNNEDIDLLKDGDKEKLLKRKRVSYNNQEIVFPGIPKENKVREAPLKYCYKF